MPARQIPIGTRALTGQHARTGAKYESGLERDFYELVSQDPLFDDVDWQPVRIAYLGACGQPRTYTPDALVTFKFDQMTGAQRRPLLAEIKYRKEYCERYGELKDRFRAASRYAESVGWEFSIFTEREIRSVRFTNRYFLNGYLERTPGTGVEKAVVAAISQQDGLDVQSLLEKLAPTRMRQAELLPSIWWMLAHGYIEADLNAPLTMQTLVRLSQRARV